MKNPWCKLLLSLAVYSGLQSIGETEARFTDPHTMDAIEVSAAVIFPSTMEKMLQDAEDVHQKIRQLDEKLSTFPREGTLEELEQSLQEVATIELERRLLVSEFSSIRGEVTAYHELIPASESAAYPFVIEGYSRIQEMHGDVSSTLLEEVRTAILNEIVQLEEKAQEGVDADENHEDSL
ncbi:hypothetical protein JOC95_001611 [Bacillus tianshenii]|uniref:Uncharacterized protein n=1 Tax=Sutcliffiella tianshenii TaxID=1463404 RepID=A0ABS2NYQ7_9BACI|nr:hypothetical protein [Bacillus tianshenii]MBM7619759.1 hypothetical protein [Bacillus tianshenii]